MKRNLLALTVATVTIFAAASDAHAAAITLRPLPGTVTVGGQLGFEVYLDLGADAALGLGAFDITLGFDPAALTFEASRMRGPLGNPAADELVDVSLGVVGSTLNLAQLSFLTAAELLDLQGPLGSVFRIAELRFTALAAGTTGIDVIGALLASADGSTLGVTQGPGLTVDVQPAPTPVPEPSSVLLVGTGIAALAARRRRTIKSNTDLADIRRAKRL